jgi:hypothetical protein
MTMTHFDSLDDHAADALRGGDGCMPKHCGTKPPIYTHQRPYFYLPMIKLPMIYLPKISLDWGKCKPSATPSPC